MNQTEDVFIHQVSLPLTNSSHPQMCRAPKGNAWECNAETLGKKDMNLSCNLAPKGVKLGESDSKITWNTKWLFIR